MRVITSSALTQKSLRKIKQTVIIKIWSFYRLIVRKVLNQKPQNSGKTFNRVFHISVKKKKIIGSEILEIVIKIMWKEGLKIIKIIFRKAKYFEDFVCLNRSSSNFKIIGFYEWIWEAHSRIKFKMHWVY